ncbi:hypothetical protein CMK12_09670 [Candidatus Poribacteria bacterium]|jgi:hypothetical protein|nr:hypothetical protein [Candidatus Poribacteria bacterium]MDP6596200.1 hypothetical protein [Candidatus Poribacteria bacterium]MDP6746857.1 hypothetical protein [Candidatus Poribacteria bacterium]MDP6997130.1 hypothetical protein [Candidatus Poribacteria bacterium]
MSRKPVKARQLAPGTVFWQIVKPLTRVGCSPERIAGRLKQINADDFSKPVSRETIYAAPYGFQKVNDAGS